MTVWKPDYGEGYGRENSVDMAAQLPGGLVELTGAGGVVVDARDGVHLPRGARGGRALGDEPGPHADDRMI